MTEGEEEKERLAKSLIIVTMVTQTRSLPRYPLRCDATTPIHLQYRTVPTHYPLLHPLLVFPSLVLPTQVHGTHSFLFPVPVQFTAPLPFLFFVHFMAAIPFPSHSCTVLFKSLEQSFLNNSQLLLGMQHNADYKISTIIFFPG